MTSKEASDKCTVLIVDDQPVNIHALAKLIRDDYHILAATIGSKALEIAFGDNAPDLILLDIMMPEMDGYEVCRRLKANPKTVDIPVIFVTGKTSMDDEAYGLKLGAVDYISKPYQVPIIRARVRNQIELLQARKTAQIAHKKLSLELEAMDQLQQRILPTREFRFHSLSAQGIYIPSGLASGDYFDFLPTGENGLRCVVADVSGHGARAAFIMAIVRTVFHFVETRTLSLSELLNILNRQLLETLGDEGDFITIFVADIDVHKKRIEYINAGHCPAFFIDDRGFIEVEATGLLAGIFETRFESRFMDIQGKWKLLIYTDGIYECTVNDEQIFGYENFRDLCSELLSDDGFQVTSLPAYVRKAAHGSIDVTDDQTALLVKSVS